MRKTERVFKVKYIRPAKSFLTPQYFQVFKGNRRSSASHRTLKQTTEDKN